MRIRLEARPEPSRLASWLSPIAATVAVIVIGLAVFVWQQRSSVENKIDHEKNHVCNSFDATFFGVHLAAPDSVKKKCRHLGSG